MAIDGGKILAYLELDTSGYTAAMTSAQQQLAEAATVGASFEQRLTGIGNAAQSVGGILTLGLTTSLLATGTAATKTAMDFESAFAGVRKTVDATEEEYAALSDSVIELSERIPQSASDLAGIMEIAGQLGVGKDDLTGFTETIANLGVATNLSGEEAATMLAQFANIMRMPLSDIGRLGSVIVDLGNNCATTERDITEMAQRLAGTGSMLSLSGAQVMGLSATMASLGINAEAGGSAMSKTLQTINTAVLGGGKDLNAFAKLAGQSATDFAAAWRADPMQALNAFLAGLGSIKERGGDVTAALSDVGLKDMRITDTLQRLASAEGDLNANLQLANNAWSQNTALQAEADKRYETTESKLQMARNSVQNAAAALGDTLLPYVAQGADLVAQLAQGFSELDEGLQQTLLTTAAVGVGAGPVLTVAGTLLKTLTSPVGLVAALGLLGVVGVQAFRKAEQAALQAGLAARFGEITLSAQEMDEAVDQLFEGTRSQHLQFTALLDDAQAELDDKVAAFGDQKLKLDKLLIQAELGLQVDPQTLKEAAAQLALDASAAIESQQVSANLAVDAVFGANDPDGARLKNSFNAYFNQADETALSKGIELANAIEQGLQDGFLDETEQATINALRQELAEITARATSVDTQGAMLRFKTEAAQVELTPESLKGLMQRAQTALQAGVDEINQNGEQALTYTYNVAAAEGWSDEKLKTEVDAINAQVAENLRGWNADTLQVVWESIGSRITDGFSTEIGQAAEKLPQIFQQATANANEWADLNGVDRGSEEYVSNLMQNIGFAFADADWDGVLGADGRKQAQAMYAELAPTHDTLQQLATEMGTDFPPLLQEALSQLDMLQLLTMDSGDASNVFRAYLFQTFQGMEDGADGLDMGQVFLNSLGSADLGSAADALVQPAVDAVSDAADAFAQEGGNAAEGYARGMTSGMGAVQQAGAGLARAALDSMRRAQDSHSPSRKFRQEGKNATDGYTGGLDGNAARRAGRDMAQAALKGVQEGQNSHSPSRRMQALGVDGVKGYVNGLRSMDTGSAGKSMAQGAVTGATASVNLIQGYKNTLSAMLTKQQAELEQKAEEERKRRAAAAARAAKAAAEAAEAARKAATLKGIQDTGAAALAADAQANQQRMAQIASETFALMAFAGQHSIWYQQDKGTTECQAVKERYNALIAQENADYEARRKALDGQKEQLDALKSYHDQRLAALKEQRDAEVSAVKDLYDTQQQMALDWLDRQSSLLQQELDAKQAAYDEEDYQQELADLKKRQRQTKSAREKRELQEEIDRKERDHALEQQRSALQETLDGYSALREAVQSGLIGLGDLTGSSAFGDLSFGTAGLDKLDTITGQVLQQVLQSLDRNALASGTSATVSAAQMAAALASAGQQATTPLTVQKEGNHYSIDLRGCVVRDESDIDAIVEKLEARIRAAGR